MIKRLLLLAVLWAASTAQALTTPEALAIAAGESDARIEALGKALATADDKTAAFLQALSDDGVKVAGGKVFVVKDDKAFDPVTGAETPLPEGAEDVVNNNRMRGELDAALASLKLFSKDAKVRAESIKALQGSTDA